VPGGSEVSATCVMLSLLLETPGVTNTLNSSTSIPTNSTLHQNSETARPDHLIDICTYTITENYM